jgi:hypothetical protein
MELRRLVVGTLVVGLGLAGCASGGSGDEGRAASKATTASVAAPSGPATTPPPSSRAAEPAGDARAALAKATRKLGDQSMRLRMTMTGVMSATGSADPASGALQMRMQLGDPQGTSFEVRSTGKDIYLKFGGELGRKTGDQWMRIKGDSVPGGLGLGSAQDPGDAQRLLRGIKEVRRDGPLGFKGTLDLTKSPSANPSSVKALGDKARALPFTARMDEQGRLVGLTLQMDAVNPSVPPMVVRYYDFGAKVSVTKPSGRIVDAPKEVVKGFNA